MMLIIRPFLRYSGCHSYDTSALNIALGIKYKIDDYSYGGSDELFETVTLSQANALLVQLEQNSTVEGKTVQAESP